MCYVGSESSYSILHEGERELPPEPKGITKNVVELYAMAEESKRLDSAYVRNLVRVESPPSCSHGPGDSRTGFFNADDILV
ncbi:hypothetical protein BHE74_00019078 [Ensete ventricosum]|nr:hypothetical protein BHE74_00019078 [Ensete ventricosum]RZR97769.1 hypothetical protein BHM03_00027014 [Ensete ventricosum]